MVFVRILLFMAGLALVGLTIRSALQTFVLPRAVHDRLTRGVFAVTRVAFGLLARRANTYVERDRVMALYSPTSLLLLPVVWLALVLIGYTGIYLGVGVRDLRTAVTISGSSLVTLGFAPPRTVVQMVLVFTEAGVGLLLAALLIAYLPTMYSAWQRREQVVALLEVRAGSPPTAAEMILRFFRIDMLSHLSLLWESWEIWFVDLEESHTSLAPLVFFRSPQPDRSWVTAAGAVLDAASLMVSAVDVPRDPQAQLTIRSGYIALRRIASFFGIRFDADPRPTDPISISREEFDAVLDELDAQGVPLKADRMQAWLDFSGWRVNYDTTLLALANLTMAPYAPWTSDRSPVYQMLRGISPARRFRLPSAE